jgi:polyhydroxybutyrate depolymerase
VPGWLTSVVTDATTVSVPVHPGDYELSLLVDDRTRTFLLHVPPQAQHDEPLPVVLNFHGAGSSAAQQCQYTGMNVTADRHGFLLVYPNGTGFTPRQRRFLSFNAGGCCPPASNSRVDDVRFAETILEVLREKTAVDPDRQYVTGISNGGMMAHRLAADSDRFAAIAPVAGQLNVNSLRPSRPVSVMQFHSVDDRRVRYEGRPRSWMGTRFPPVQVGIDQWVAHDDCPRAPVVGDPVRGVPGSLNDGQTMTKYTYGPGQAGSEVVLYKFTGVGHVWPGATYSLPRLIGRATTLVDANETMWAFFAAHPRATG